MDAYNVLRQNRTFVPRFQDISIKQKLTAIIMIASSVALLLVSAGFVTYELVTFRQTMASDISTLGKIIGDRSTAALTFDNKGDAEEDLRALKFRTHIASAALYDKNGKLYATYRATNVADTFSQPPGGRRRAFRVRPPGSLPKNIRRR